MSASWRSGMLAWPGTMQKRVIRRHPIPEHHAFFIQEPLPAAPVISQPTQPEVMMSWTQLTQMATRLPSSKNEVDRTVGQSDKPTQRVLGDNREHDKLNRYHAQLRRA